MTSAKVTSQHLSRPAYIYIRQSTMNQVRNNLESTERQYALRDKAQQLGWCPTMIRVLDRDLGRSGARTEGREDFKTLMADVSMGQVGAVFSLEASRLARSQQDWLRLVEICALTGTLVIDEDGCYDSSDFNDELLLGLKAIIAKTELHLIRERCQGGKLNKARRGELRLPLSIGYRHDECGQVVMDPDAEVRSAVAMLFTVFRERRSALGVVQHFRAHGLKFPRRRHGGPWEGELLWGNLTLGRVCDILHSPLYTGAYIYGRRRTAQIPTPDGKAKTRTTKVAMDDWLVDIRDHHEGYIPWEEFIENQRILDQNRPAATHAGGTGAAREGHALLQGLLVCGVCGRKLTVRYTGEGGKRAVYDCSLARREGRSAQPCISIGAAPLDAAISARAIEVMQPDEIEIALEAMRELERRDESIRRQWELRIDRAEYEAGLAERRYNEVDPANRLVAGTLEARWNSRLEAVAELRREYEAFKRGGMKVATPEQRRRALALAKDFPRIWTSKKTPNKQRKQMLQLLVKDITVERERGSKLATLHVRWQGGACEDLTVEIPPHVAIQTRIPEVSLERIRELATDQLPDAEIADILNREGLTGSRGTAFTAASVRRIRRDKRITREVLRDGELTVRQAAERFDVCAEVIRTWIQDDLLVARRGRGRGRPYYVTIDPEREEELQALARATARPWQRKPNRKT